MTTALIIAVILATVLFASSELDGDGGEVG